MLLSERADPDPLFYRSTGPLLERIRDPERRHYTQNVLCVPLSCDDSIAMARECIAIDDCGVLDAEDVEQLHEKIQAAVRSLEVSTGAERKRTNHLGNTTTAGNFRITRSPPGSINTIPPGGTRTPLIFTMTRFPSRRAEKSIGP